MSATPPSVPAHGSVLRPRAIFWVAVLLIGIGAGVALLLVGTSSRTSNPAVPVSEHPAATWAAGKLRAPDISLTDQNGAPVSLAAYRGRPVIVTFIDPLCRDYCPIEASHLNQVVRGFPAGSRPAVVAVSVNVHGNARTNLMQDAAKWNLVPQWRWGIGSEAQLSSVWKSYHIGVLPTTKKVAGVTVHSILHTRGGIRRRRRRVSARHLPLAVQRRRRHAHVEGISVARSTRRSTTATASAASAAMTMTRRSWLRDDEPSTLVVADRVTPDAFASACTAVIDESTRPVGLGSTVQLGEYRALGGAVLSRPVESEPVRHHDEQSVLVDVLQLRAEEAGVRLGLPPEARDRPEVIAAADHGDADRESLAVGLVDERDELLLLRLRRLDVEREEHLLREKVVARRIAVGARRRRRTREQRGSEYDDGRRPHPPALSRSSTENGWPPCGCTWNESPQWPIFEIADALAIGLFRFGAFAQHLADVADARNARPVSHSSAGSSL